MDKIPKSNLHPVHRGIGHGEDQGHLRRTQGDVPAAACGRDGRRDGHLGAFSRAPILENPIVFLT